MPAYGPALYQSFRALHFVRDLPEDFVQRVESGLDEQTRAGLADGIRILRRSRRLVTGATLLFFAGLLSIPVLWIADYMVGGWIPDFSYFATAGAAWLVAFGCLIALVLDSSLHRTEISRVLTFHEALRRSSLARDLV